MFTLWNAVFALFAPPTGLPDTPDSHVVRLRPPYALAVHPAWEIPGSAMLIRPGMKFDPDCGRPSVSGVTMDGDTTIHVVYAVERAAVTGNWFVARYSDKWYCLLRLDDPNAEPSRPEGLREVNRLLADDGCGPLSDADFRTFEEWRDERDRTRERKRLTLTSGGLAAVLVGWAAVGAVLAIRRTKPT